MNFSFKNGLVGVGLAKTFFFVNDDAVLDDRNDTRLPVFRRWRKKDLVKKKIRIGLRTSQRREDGGKRVGVVKIAVGFERVGIGTRESQLTCKTSLPFGHSPLKKGD